MCAPASLVLRVNAVADSYRWQDGSAQAAFTARQTGLYRATALRAGCSWTDSVRVDIIQPRKPNLGRDTLLCENTTLTLRSDVQAQILRWQDGSVGNLFAVRSPGLYVLQAIEGPCSASDTIAVAFRRCAVFKAYLPNVFSPNGDGINDDFRPLLPPGIVIGKYEFRIFDRWGNLVFESNDPEKSWDGSFRGEILPQGVFLYHLFLEYKDDFEENTARFSGDVLLAR